MSSLPQARREAFAPLKWLASENKKKMNIRKWLRNYCENYIRF
jgi:hypothetical protein